jgi:uncharacterized protein YbjT (DUF2867 family)
MITLVTGATGSVGSRVVHELRARNVAVRAFAPDRDRAVAKLGPAVDIAEGDFRDETSIRAAMRGADQVYLLTPNHPQQAEWEMSIIDAAAVTGVRRIVKLSASGATPGSVLDFWDMHGRIQQHLLAAPVASVLLRPSFFMSNVLMSADSVRGAGALFLPAAGAKVAMVDPQDVAAAAAAILADGDGRHDGRSYLLSGPDAITFDDVAAAVSAVTKRPVGFIPVPDDAAHAQLTQAGLPEWFASNLVTLFRLLREGAAAQVTGDVQTITGREPRSITQFVCDHAAAFR